MEKLDEDLKRIDSTFLEASMVIRAMNYRIEQLGAFVRNREDKIRILEDQIMSLREELERVKSC